MSGFVEGVRENTSKVGQFIRDGWAELKRVRWPSRKELISYTIVVSVTCVVMGALVFLFDIGIASLFKLVGVSH